MAKPLKIGIAGLGNVGAGVVKMLQLHRDLIAERAGTAIEIVSVSARDKGKARNLDLASYEWVDTPESMAGDPRLDVVVELMGGAEGPAHNLVERALKGRKSVVTANKALLAEHGFKLAEIAANSGAALMYEGAVAGGIPVIKALREGFAGNKVNAVYGILNGTCNYILTEMRETGRPFADVLGDAQKKGYAEADPSFDIDGIDTGHKLAILTALAFGVKPDFKQMSIDGIRRISAADIAYATELGYRIKLLGTARRMENGRVIQSVEPCLVPRASTIGAVDGVYNAVFIKGDFVGTSLLVGRGAGEGPTASAVLSDLIDLARGNRAPVFSVPAADLATAEWGGAEDIHAHFYLHLSVIDEPGVLAEVAAVLRDHSISVESVIQRGRNPGQTVSIVMTTHETRQSDVDAAVAALAVKLTAEKPTVMRVEKF